MPNAAARLAGLLFVSGFCALVYQSAWLRSLRLVFGASTAATAAVLGIFLAGLGFGGLLLGRRVDRRPRPLAFYAALEAGIAVSAALTPWLVEGARAAYRALGGTTALGFAGGTAVRLLLAAATLGVPAFLMGGTLPAMARAAESAADHARRRVGMLYGWNTLGGVAGVLATTFLTIELVGVARTIWLAALVNLLVAVLANAWSRGWPPRAVESADEPPVLAPAAAAPRAFVLTAAFAVGFVFLLMEIVWYRMLAPLLGGSTYTFGLVLAVALAGIGAGGLLFALAPPRQRTPAAFGVTCAVEALALIAPFAAGDRLAELALALRGFGSWGFAPLVSAWSGIAVLVVLLPAVAAGYQFPLLVSLLGTGDRAVGRQVGAAYAWNTLGAIVGSLAGGFGLLPLLGATGLWRGATVALALLAAFALVLGRRSPGALPWRFAAVVGLAALAGALVPGPSAAWRHRPIGAGRVETTGGGPNERVRQAHAARRDVVWEADGREASVALLGGSGYAFAIHGKTDGHALRDADTQVMSGLVGALLHDDPRSALVVGLGTGSTAGWLAAVPSIERVEVAEIEPAILRVAAACAPVNRDVLDDPKVHIRIEDAREVLLTGDRRYDIVFSEPSNPYRVGIASLFSVEFYDAVRERLGTGGIFLQWLQGYEIDGELVRTVYGTLAAAFPQVETWQVGELDLLLVATVEPIAHDLERLARRVNEEPYRSALADAWGVEGADGFYAGRIAGPELAAAIAAAAAGLIERDDRPRLEFGFARNLGRIDGFRPRALRDLVAARGATPAVAGLTETELAEALSARLLAAWAPPSEIEAAGRKSGGDSDRARARRAWAEARLDEGLTAWRTAAGKPRQPIERLLLAEALAAGADPRTPAAIEAVRDDSAVAADLVEGSYRDALGDAAGASESFGRGFGLLRSTPWAFGPLVERSILRARSLAERVPAVAPALAAALGEPFAVHAHDELRRRVLFDLALRSSGDCRPALATFERDPPWERAFLRQRYECHRRYGGAGLERAAADLDRFLDAEPTGVADWQLPPPAPSVAAGRIPGELR